MYAVLDLCRPLPDIHAMGRAQLLHEVFAEVARRHPDAVAVDVPPSAQDPARHTLTYAELDAHSDQLARRLEPLVDAERIVALLLPRNHLLYIAQIAVLKAGGAYTCLDPSFPDTRMQFVLGDADPVVLLTTGDLAARVGDFGPVIDVAEVIANAPPAPDPLPPRPWLTPEGLAYVIYTSGTTGWPKGVMITHRGVVNLVRGDGEYFDLGPGDRVAQGSSPAYDSSVEESWMAWGVGATVLVLDDDVVRLGPDLVPWMRAERVTVLCPPPTLLRTTGCDDPDTALPDLRLLYVGGEALTPDIADRWARGRWMVNGYGPTECTVTCVRSRVRPGEPVTIGRAMAGSVAHVLDADLDPLPDGEAGELCMSGAGLARGYLNRPELTAERFVDHPKLGRLYRTGDLVRRLSSGDLDYLGRIDSQVKIRGYRVELGAIEAHLAGRPGVHGAACKLQGEGAAQQLVAFVVADPSVAAPDLAGARAHLQEQLPAYMVPAHIAVLDALPISTGGKLDRKALPDVELAVEDDGQRVVDPRDEGEALVLQAFEEALGRRVSVEADFFASGGDSLRAARTVSALRDHPRTAPATVRDLYEAPTVAGLAARIAAKGEAAPALVPARPPGARPGLATAVQAAWLTFGLLSAAPIFYVLAFIVLPWVLLLIGLIPALLLAPIVGLVLSVAWTPIGLGITMLAKRILIGRYRPGRYPIWGSLYVRHWMVTGIASTVPWALWSGTIFLNAFLRALGARVGRRVHIHSGVGVASGGWDLLDIGDDVTLARDAALRLVEFHDQAMEIGPIRIGDGAVLNTRAGVGPHTHVGEDAWLTNLSMLPARGRIPPGEMWDGVPARAVGPAPSPPEAPRSPWSPTRHGLALIASRFGLSLLRSLPFYVIAIAAVQGTGLSTPDAVTWLYTPSFDPGLLLALAAIVAVSQAANVFWDALVARLLGRVRPGVVSRWSPAYLRVWLKAALVERAGLVLSGSLFWPPWLRLAGMRVGPDCEVSTIVDVTPELVHLASSCFFADGIYLGPPRLHRGTVTLGEVSFAPNTFLGNHVVVPPGTTLPRDLLLGVCTVADETQARPDSAFFGHPAFELPRREVVELSRDLTHDPAWYRYANRVFWESLRFVVAIPLLAVLLALLQLIPGAAATQSVALFLLVTMPAAGLAAGGSLLLLTFALKWTLIGRARPGQHALWSCWCSRWDFLYVAWGAWGGAVAGLEGTLMIGWWLRAMGVRVGRLVFLGGGFSQVVDPDMLHFEDGATVAAMFQAHSFEDRVLKLAPVYIRRDATVRPAAVLMYGADIGAGAAVAEHSVVMKHERLLPDRYHVGAPTRPGVLPGSDSPSDDGEARQQV